VQEIRRKSTGNFRLLPKLAKFGHIYHKHGVISAKKSAHNEKKRKSSLEARKMKLEG
jgi:hypothetical protein